MGYGMSQMGSDFRIQKEYLPELLQDLKGAALKGEYWAWCDMTKLREA